MTPHTFQGRSLPLPGLRALAPCFFKDIVPMGAGGVEQGPPRVLDQGLTLKVAVTSGAHVR